VVTGLIVIRLLDGDGGGPIGREGEVRVGCEGGGEAEEELFCHGVAEATESERAFDQTSTGVFLLPVWDGGRGPL
jgi:hypothetical protein